MFRSSLVGIATLILFAVSCAGRSARASGRPSRLSLDDALRLADEGNFDLRAARGDVEVALGQQRTAGQFPNPILGLSSSKYKLTQPNGTTQGNSFFQRSYDSIASIGQLVEVGGKRTQRRASAEAAVAAARARLDEVRRQLDLNVTKAYLAALLADGNRAVLENSALSLRREASIAAARLQAGDISNADRDQIEVAAAQLELNARSAANAALAARIQLQLLLGNANPDGQIQLADTLSRLGHLISSGVGIGAPLRPDIAAARASLAKATADLKLEKANRIPDPTFQLQYEREPTATLQSLGFAMTIPLPLPNYNLGAVRTARAAQLQAAAKVDQTQSIYRADVAAARGAYQEANARAHRYEEQISAQAERVRESVSFAYARGGASLVDLLTAQRAANEVRAATLQAQADRASAAAALSAALNQPVRSTTPNRLPTR